MHFDAGITIFRQLVQLGADGTFSELFRNRSPAPQPSLRPVVPAYHACYIPPRRSQPMPRSLPSLNSSATIPSPPPATLRASNRFLLLCFQHLLSCFFRNSFAFTSICVAPWHFPARVFRNSTVTSHESQVTLFHGFAASCSLLPLFFRLPSFVFNRLQPLCPK